MRGNDQIERINPMRCTKCATTNAYKVNYCKDCGAKFEVSDYEKAFNESFSGKLQHLIDEIKDNPFSKITGSIYFKIISLVVVLGIGIFCYYQKTGIASDKFQFVATEDYSVQYNSESNEYYIIAKSEEVSLMVYCPYELENISVSKSNPYTLKSDSTPLHNEGLSKQASVNVTYGDTLSFDCKYKDGTKETINAKVYEDR